MTVVRKWIHLSEEQVAWFEDTYPGGSLSKLCDMLLREYRKAHYIEPADMAAIGALALKKILEEE